MWYRTGGWSIAHSHSSSSSFFLFDLFFFPSQPQPTNRAVVELVQKNKMREHARAPRQPSPPRPGSQSTLPRSHCLVSYPIIPLIAFGPSAPAFFFGIDLSFSVNSISWKNTLRVIVKGGRGSTSTGTNHLVCFFSCLLVRDKRGYIAQRTKRNFSLVFWVVQERFTCQGVLGPFPLLFLFSIHLAHSCMYLSVRRRFYPVGLRGELGGVGIYKCWSWNI